MFDVGFAEIVIVLVLGLIVLGPERLPRAIKTVAYWWRKLRNHMHTLQAEIDKEIAETNVKEHVKEYQSHVDDIRQAADVHNHNASVRPNTTASDNHTQSETHTPQ